MAKENEDLGMAIDVVTEALRFMEERKSITLYSNCYEIVVDQEVSEDCAIGRVDRKNVAAGISGKIITENDYDESKGEISCTPAFLELVESIFGTKIKVDKEPKFIEGCNSSISQSRFVFVPFRELFASDRIRPLRKDGINEEVRAEQLFYSTFDEENRRSYENLADDYNQLQTGQLTKVYDELVAYDSRNDRREMYIPFHEISSDRREGLFPLIRVTNNYSLLPLPVLCGASVRITASLDESIFLRCVTDSVTDSFLFEWGGIVLDPGGIVVNEWTSLARILEYSKLDLEEAD